MQSNTKVRTATHLNVYLLLYKEDSVLLSLRKNTGYYDGFYGLVAGHVEPDESAIEAMLREAYEEAGLQLQREHLKLVYVMHRQSNRANLDLFFAYFDCKEAFVNRELDKCETLAYFPVDELPLNTIDYIKEVIQAVSTGDLYAESGWETSKRVLL